MFAAFVKRAFRAAGLDLEWRDRLAEQIPPRYLRSRYVPAIYRHNLSRLLYFHHMFERVRGVPGDILECGVSIGHGIVVWALLCDTSGADRRVFGFDSFSGFPPPLDQDRKRDASHHVSTGDYASPPELVSRVLVEARVSPRFLEQNVRLVPGYFDKTLPSYDGTIALLHLDCDLYGSYQTCLRELYPRVAPGGVIMFDEYEDENFPGAKQAVDEFFADKPEKPQEYRAYDYRKYYVVRGERSRTRQGS